ncbi:MULTISPECIES: alternative ribosome rescue aminoacyl-tRNA hydrolase ArfB [unclassified Oceanispirochaeta]|uniref:alternative ribosome rescue aminoacyl-tRNA hydrolase ArfB n=1 Tax=unclassified Oceanispirochaeta TaxID=2635722 RepID=UPI000E092E30|nr:MULTISPECIES: alternative ribosome rescue aminoacyl-tRNA hydrolase ArfB [unclassified Oceanispirochaeta]MBF9018042.1 aminoacyl-tRNA hydrolase [Oceanispirochaeta sp. M2]NPD73877.1 aminoacyl-tRNA hydrolase [Oceanispirochaeta sp. M1]RDG30337.1 aminoacyl-tRNA hydrolase [Oceanispirochaeta sp. M1]
MTKEDLIEAIQKEGKFSFSRSGGPGGQNVNKVNTKVLLTISPDNLECLSDEEIHRVKVKLPGRINSEGEFYIQFQEERSQLMNREKAVERMAELISQALVVKRKRKKTRPGRAAVQRRLDGKKKLSNKKKSRGAVRFHD